jgi:cellulose synthase/poly-beta-1,6-N-acetylglucosamine synthase-like glycosyltransferase
MTRAAALICTKDRSELLGPCLDALLTSLGPDDELLLIDAPGGSELRHPDPRLRYLIADRAGKSHQINAGIQAAAAPLILLTDDDVRVPEGWVEGMLEPFADPTVGMVCGRVLGLSAVPGSTDPPPGAAGMAPLETWMFAHGAAMAVRTIAATETGGFDERLGPGTSAVGEDHDFLLRVRERGWKVSLSSAPAAVHVSWRTAEADYFNALAYERGAGAVVGATIRRRVPERWRLLRRRLSYQLRLLIDHRAFGTKALMAFVGGVVYGLGMAPRRFLNAPQDQV